MSLSSLLLQQQMSETEANLQDVYDAEDRRRQKAGKWAGLGNFGGGLLGLGAAAALGVTAPWMVGLIAGAGSLGGGKLAEQWAGGSTDQRTSLGQNVDTITGGIKEFSQKVKDRYKKNVDRFQKEQNSRIFNKAVSTGIKAGMFAWQDPSNQFTRGSNYLRSKLGLSQAGGPVIPDTTDAINTMQAYDPFGSPPSQFGVTPNPTNVMSGPMAAQVAADPTIGEGVLSYDNWMEQQTAPITQNIMGGWSDISNWNPLEQAMNRGSAMKSIGLPTPPMNMGSPRRIGYDQYPSGFIGAPNPYLQGNTYTNKP